MSPNNDVTDRKLSPSTKSESNTTKFPSSLSPPSSSSSSPYASQNSKPIAKVVHFSPKIIQVDKPIFTDKPTVRASRNTPKSSKKGMFVPPVPPPIKTPSSMTPYKDTPTQMTRVPRDKNIPLVVYNPPKIKPQILRPQQPSVVPVVPMTTCGNIIIARPLFAGNAASHLYPPPTLISSSQLKKLTTKTQRLGSNKAAKEKKSSSSSSNIVSPTTSLTYPCFNVHQPQLQMPSPLVYEKQIKMEATTDYSSNNNVNDSKPLSGDFRKWSVAEVYRHFSNSDCSKYADIFKDQVLIVLFLCVSSRYIRLVKNK